MLLKLHLENFKSWQKLDMTLGRVTGLFGTNSSGKSSILQFLLLLKQTKDATDRGLVLDLGGQNQLINLGSYKDLIYQHDEELSLKWSLGSISTVRLKGEDFKKFKTCVELILKNNEMKVSFLSYQYGSFFSETKLKNVNNEYEIRVVNDKNNSEIIQNSNYKPTKTHIFQLLLENDSLIFHTHIGICETMYESIIDEIYYLAPLRDYPKREYQWSGASPSHVGYRGEHSINAILSATIRNETRLIPDSNETKPFQEVIAYWLKTLGLIHEFYVKEIAQGTGLYRAIVKITKESPETFLTDVGFGVSQVLPALVLLYYVPEDSIILMEQPEIHLHPAVQSGLADVILYVAKERNLQVIVESHSEHLLRRLQRRIAEAQYSSDDLKLYFCHSENGASQLSDLQINQYGEIENYPDNFFGDEMAEIAATRKAALKRKIQESSNNA